jgi:hypothetical protein
MDAIDIDVKYRPAGWKEIMTGPEMAMWVRSHSKEDWQEPFPGIFWLSPRLFTLWQLHFVD